MKYILSQDEYNSLVNAKKELENKNFTNLFRAARIIAYSEPWVYPKWRDEKNVQDETQYYCFRSKDLGDNVPESATHIAEYCYGCPANDFCPYDYKEWPK